MTMSRAVPIVSVTDLPAATRAYAELLGLEVIMDHGWIVTLASPGERAQLSLITADATAPVNPVASLQVDDVDAAYAVARAQGLEIVHGPADEEWGVRRFFLRDSSGNVINVVGHR